MEAIVPTQAQLRPQRSPKKKRSLKRTATPRRPLDPSRVLPINIDQNELSGIMERIAAGQETDPNAAFSKIYGLALDSIAEALKGALLSLVQNLQSASDADLPPLFSGLFPERDSQTLERVSQSLSQKIDLSREKIQLALERQNHAPAFGNYESFARQVRAHGIQTHFQNAANRVSNALMPAHITADRLREICEDVRLYKPQKSTHDTFKIDLTRLPERSTLHFTTGPAKPSETAEQRTSTPNGATLQPDTRNASDAAPFTQPELVQTPLSQTRSFSNDVPPHERDSAQNHAVTTTDVAPTQSTSATPHGAPDQLIPALEQALLSAALANKADTTHNVSVSQVESQAANALKTFGVELVQTFDGITNMMSEFANQLTAAIIEDQAHRLPTLSETLENDPRLQNDPELKDFVSFLDGDAPLPNDDVNIDNDELAAAFGSLLDMLED